jgi:hypothetical protein
MVDNFFKNKLIYYYRHRALDIIDKMNKNKNDFESLKSLLLSF